MIERQGRRTGGHLAQRLEVGVRAQHHRRAHLGGRLVGGNRQDPQGLAERDCGLVGHAGQLAATDHCHDGGLRHGA